MREVKHYVLTVGRDDGQPVRELRPLPGGTAALVALQLYERVEDEPLKEMITDLLAERDRRRNGWTA